MKVTKRGVATPGYNDVTCTLHHTAVTGALQFCASIFTFIFVEATSHQPLLALFESQNPLYAISTFTSLVCLLVGAFNKENVLSSKIVSIHAIDVRSGEH